MSGDKIEKQADTGASSDEASKRLWVEDAEADGLNMSDGSGDPEFSAFVKDQLVVCVDGFEGPLDFLLALARTQKVDLAKISVVDLADQYLTFIDEAERLRLELAADYLVMASWLAYLKSRLLLPDDEDNEEGPSADELAAHLAFRLKRLEAMREAAGSIMERKQLGRDVFARGMPEGIRVLKTPEYQADTFELLSAYARQRQRTSETRHEVKRRKTWSIKQARDRLEGILGVSLDWLPMDRFLDDPSLTEELQKSVLASTFSASLEMARDGNLELKQAQPFAPLYLRRRDQSQDR